MGCAAPTYCVIMGRRASSPLQGCRGVYFERVEAESLVVAIWRISWCIVGIGQIGGTLSPGSLGNIM